MKNTSIPYHVVDLPKARRETPNMLDIYWWRHAVYALLEVDVTVPKQFIADYKARTSEALSFTGYPAYCLAQAVEQDKSVQAYMKGGKKLMMFDDVDVGLPIEREIGGKRTPIGHVIHGANRKSFLEIHREIRAVQTRPASPSRGMPRWLQLACCSLLPSPQDSWLFCDSPSGRILGSRSRRQGRSASLRWECLARAAAVAGG